MGTLLYTHRLWSKFDEKRKNFAYLLLSSSAILTMLSRVSLLSE